MPKQTCLLNLIASYIWRHFLEIEVTYYLIFMPCIVSWSIFFYFLLKNYIISNTKNLCYSFYLTTPVSLKICSFLSLILIKFRSRYALWSIIFVSICIFIPFKLTSTILQCTCNCLYRFIVIINEYICLCFFGLVKFLVFLFTKLFGKK